MDTTTTQQTPVKPTGNEYRRMHSGTGDWEAWGAELGRIAAAVTDWRCQLRGIEKPWLCWNVSDRLCRIQQRLVLEFGWTPVVDGDPLAGAPTLLPGAIRFDCNRLLDLPTMWMWFPVEFVHRFTSKLAFWHSDLIVSRRDMDCLVKTFDRLDDGETAAYMPRVRWWSKAAPCPGLAACATRGGSKDQWDHGCGWWRWFAKHPNFQGNYQHRGDNWDHGYGIRYWAKHYGGVIRKVSVDERGHCKVPWDRWKGKMSKAESIESFHNVDEIVRRLDIADLDDQDARQSA